MASLLPKTTTRTAVGVLQVVLLAGLAAYGVRVLPGIGLGADYQPWADFWLYNGLLVLATSLCLLRALLVRAERRAWLFLGAGMAMWTIGDLYYATVLHDVDPVPFPSIADGF